MAKILRIGIDVGSTTVKMIVLDKKDNVLYKEYRRHFSDTKKTIKDLFLEVIEKFPKDKFSITMTGSGAIALAKYLDVDFVQEVIACKNAIKKYASGVDVAMNEWILCRWYWSFPRPNGSFIKYYNRRT